jgi:hypothetical protein
MTSKAGAAVPFARAAGLLEDLAGIRLTVKRVERSSEASGAAQAAASRAQARLIAHRKVIPLPPEPLPDKLYAVIDGTGVPVTSKETEGRDGKGVDGRARTREVKMAVFFPQDKLDEDGHPVRDRASSSHIATFEPAATFSGLVKAEGIRRGAGHVRQMTIIGDGAAWIWGIATRVSPEATQVADLYHAREHLHSLTRSLEFMLLDRRDEWLAARLVRYRPPPQAVRHALDRQRRRRHHRPALRRGLQPVGSALPCTAPQDTSRLTSPLPWSE